jgi:hypothetical protein
MKLSDLIKSTSWLSIEATFLRIYPIDEDNMLDYQAVFDILKYGTTPTENKISIIISREIDTFDNEEYIDISGLDPDPDKKEDKLTDSLALEFTSWDKWLGMEINERTLKEFSSLEIICHCLWEMTFISSDPREIAEELEKIADIRNEFKTMTEEEKKEKFISFDDVKNYFSLS